MTFKKNNLGDMVAYNNNYYLAISGTYELEKKVLTELDEIRFERWEDLEPIMFVKRHKYATDEFYTEMEAHCGN